MKWRLCSSGLYISITAPLSTSACSSAVRVSALVKLNGATLAAAIVSKTLKCGFASLTRALFMPNIRGSGSFSFSLFFHIIEFLEVETSNCCRSLRRKAFYCARRRRAVDAHRDDGKRFIVGADDKLTAFLELERAVCIHLLCKQC